VAQSFPAFFKIKEKNVGGSLKILKNNDTIAPVKVAEKSNSAESLWRKVDKFSLARFTAFKCLKFPTN
jgi:hypothetical protein